MLSDIRDWLYTKKAWAGAIIAAVFQYADLIRSILADKNVSFDELETGIQAGAALVTTILVMLGVYKARNAPKYEELPTVPGDRA